MESYHHRYLEVIIQKSWNDVYVIRGDFTGYPDIAPDSSRLIEQSDVTSFNKSSKIPWIAGQGILNFLLDFDQILQAVGCLRSIGSLKRNNGCDSRVLTKLVTEFNEFT